MLWPFLISAPERRFANEQKVFGNYQKNLRLCSELSIQFDGPERYECCSKNHCGRAKINGEILTCCAVGASWSFLIAEIRSLHDDIL